MKVLWLIGAFALLILLIVSLPGTPSSRAAEDAFQDRLRVKVNGKAEVRSFKKTDGLKYVKDGIDTYDLEFVAEADMPGGHWEKDTYHGKVIFIRTEKGWRPVETNASSDSETAARERQEHERLMAVRAKQRLNLIESALNLYKLDNFTYPSTEQGLRALLEEPKTDPLAKNWKARGYIRKGDEKDPWGNDYHYESPGKHGEIDIYTLGSDNAPGGDLLAEDIGNWDIGN